MNPTDIARLSGVTRPTIYAIRGGKGHALTDTLIKIANALASRSKKMLDIDPERANTNFQQLAHAAGTQEGARLVSMHEPRAGYIAVSTADPGWQTPEEFSEWTRRNYGVSVDFASIGTNRRIGPRTRRAFAGMLDLVTGVEGDLP